MVQFLTHVLVQVWCVLTVGPVPALGWLRQAASVLVDGVDQDVMVS